MTSLPPQPLSPLDGRYRAAVGELGEHLSEAGLNRARVQVEVEWLIAQTDRGFFGSSPLSAEQKAQLRSIVTEFGQADIDELASLEATTRHDVKAVEYYVRRRLRAARPRRDRRAHALRLHERGHQQPLLRHHRARRGARGLAAEVPPRHRHPLRPRGRAPRRGDAVAHARPARDARRPWARSSRSSRSASSASPAQVEATEYLGKFSGATGTFSAHVVAAPDVSWPEVSREFVESLGLTWNPLTTQIESHDWQAELYARVSHANRVLHNLATDIWTYISLGYFRQIPQAGATGSSTMPHKVNPIRFENAEANLELSSAVLDSLAATLVTSRLQRDLTDSSAQRNIGVGFGHSLLALDNIQRGLGEIDLDRTLLLDDLDGNWEVLGEAIQTVIRAEVVAGRSTIADPYALLKELTRGKRVGAAELAAFVEGLEIGDAAKQRLLALTPATYTGIASELVDRL